MDTIVTCKLFSSRTGKLGHCFLTTSTLVFNGTKVVGCCDATITGDSRYNRRMILSTFRDFLHQENNGATCETWVNNDGNFGAVYTIQKVWHA